MVITPSFYAHTCAVRRGAKSAKLIGGIPATFWTSLLGREPWPEAMVSVSIRSLSPYSADTPAATEPSIRALRSMSLCFADWPMMSAMTSARFVSRWMRRPDRDDFRRLPWSHWVTTT